MRSPIYFDYAATTPVDPRVVDTMQQYLTQDGVFANAASNHSLARTAKEAIEFARAEVAAVIQADPAEIIWTSGATEANNLALKGAAQLYQQKGKHIVTVKTEHLSVLDCCQQLEKQGFQLTYLTPNSNGRIDLAQLELALRSDTILVSIMHVNNELGIIQDIASIGQLTAARGILLHVDAAQSIGKVVVDVNQMSADLMSLSAHKVYGPKGIGALYVRKKPRVRVAAQIHGGGQENGMRSGTLATHQIVAMGTAYHLAKEEMQKEVIRIHYLRDLFLKNIATKENLMVITDVAHSVPHILNLGFKGIKAHDLINALPELALSTGSACSSKGTEPSYVLRALGLSAERAAECVRICFGRFTTEDDVSFLVKKINAI